MEEEIWEEGDCWLCHGTGIYHSKVEVAYYDRVNGDEPYTYKCPRCGGGGKLMYWEIKEKDEQKNTVPE